MDYPPDYPQIKIHAYAPIYSSTDLQSLEKGPGLRQIKLNLCLSTVSNLVLSVIAVNLLHRHPAWTPLDISRTTDTKTVQKPSHRAGSRELRIVKPSIPYARGDIFFVTRAPGTPGNGTLKEDPHISLLITSVEFTADGRDNLFHHLQTGHLWSADMILLADKELLLKKTNCIVNFVWPKK